MIRQTTRRLWRVFGDSHSLYTTVGSRPAGEFARVQDNDPFMRRMKISLVLFVLIVLGARHHIHSAVIALRPKTYHHEGLEVVPRPPRPM